MALTKEELREIKSKRSNNKVEKLARVTLTGLYAKFAGKRLEYDEFARGDRVSFVFYWTPDNMREFVKLIGNNHNIDKQQSKEFSDALFKYSKTTGEPLIYANKRTLLPESVTYDEHSKYNIIVDLMHASGTDDTGKNFSSNYIVIRNVEPTIKNREYLTFTDEEILAIQSATLGNEPKQLN